MKLGLGTAQFGMQYGISNNERCSKDDIPEILDKAAQHEVLFLDTAPSYGESERLLGELSPKNQLFNIITKIPSLESSDYVSGMLFTTLEGSLRRLKTQSVYGLLMHNADDLLLPSGQKIWKEMQELKALGLVKKIGVSVYTSEQVERLTNLYRLDLVQLPLNVFDQRLLHNGYLSNLKKMQVEIHVRSVFFQGLLLMELNDIPYFFDPIKVNIESYNRWLAENKISRLQAALSFIASIKEVDLAVVGINSLQHLREILSCKIIGLDLDYFSRFSIQDNAMLNPSTWKLLS